MNVPPLNKHMIYHTFLAKGSDPGILVCKICDADVTNSVHMEGCPGKIIDKMQYAVNVYGSNCLRGCCGYTDRTETGENWENLVRDIVNAGSDAVKPSYTVSFVAECDEDFQEVFRAEENRQQEAYNARVHAEKEQQKQSKKAADLAALEARRGDYTEEAYVRLKKEIEER